MPHPGGRLEANDFSPERWDFWPTNEEFSKMDTSSLFWPSTKNPRDFQIGTDTWYIDGNIWTHCPLPPEVLILAKKLLCVWCFCGKKTDFFLCVFFPHTPSCFMKAVFVDCKRTHSLTPSHKDVRLLHQKSTHRGFCGRRSGSGKRRYQADMCVRQWTLTRLHGPLLFHQCELLTTM